MNLRGVTNLEVTQWRVRMVSCLQIPTTFWIGWRTTSLSYWMYIGSVMLGRWNTYIELLVPDTSPFEIETAIVKLKRYQSPGSDQILGELIQIGNEILRSEIHKLLNSIWNKEELPDQILSYQFTRRVINLTIVIIMEYHCYQLHTKFYPIFFCQG
jgi:hypothetical protein